MDMFLVFVSRVFSICQEWNVVISSRCLRSANIDSFIGGDRDLINRRLGDRRKISLCFFSFFWFGMDPQIAVLWVWPAKFIWFYQGPFTSCSRSRLQPRTFQILQSFNTHISMLTSRKLLTCIAACVTWGLTNYPHGSPYVCPTW